MKLVPTKSIEEEELDEFLYTFEYNNLDSIINRKLIKVIKMEEDSHISWILNEKTTTKLAEHILHMC